MQTRKLIALLLGLVFAGTAAAQITITSGNIPGPGSSFLLISITYEAVNTGSPGANQTWTIPEYEWSYLDTIEFIDPQGTPFAASFAGATRCIREGGEIDGYVGYSYLYERVAGDGCYLLGMGFQAQSYTFVADYQSEATYAPLPLTYPRSWTAVGRYQIGANVTVTDSTTYTVDGWGTLVTEFGSMQVLRVFAHEWQINRLPIGPPIVTDYGVSYTWLDYRGIPVAHMYPSEPTSNPNFTLGSVELMGWDFFASAPERGPVAREFAAGQNFPNPFNARTTLPLELAVPSPVTLDIYDETGRLVSSETFTLSAGRHNLAVDGSLWSSGSYFARLTAQNQDKTVKLQLIK